MTFAAVTDGIFATAIALAAVHMLLLKQRMI
jgi:hypothetical protein